MQPETEPFLSPDFRAGGILSVTESVCPECLARIPAVCREHEGGIWLEKSCGVHGDFKALIWQGSAQTYLDWDRARDSQHQNRDGENCPHACVECSSHVTEPCCVLLEVTSNCMLSCPVCFASSGPNGSRQPSLEELSETIMAIARRSTDVNLQLSGGEPTTRDDLPAIVAMAKRAGFGYVQLNTNGIRIARDPEYLDLLVRAGLDCVYLQFDSLKREATLALRGADILEAKHRAVDACEKANVACVLVATVVPGINESEMGDIIRYGASRLPFVRGAHFQPASTFGRFELDPVGNALTIPRVLALFSEQTGGQLAHADFEGGGSENSYCSFHASYLVSGAGENIAFSPVPWRVGRSKGCCSPAVSARVTARQWTLKGDKTEKAEKTEKTEMKEAKGERFGKAKSAIPIASEPWEADSLDAFLDAWENHTFTVSGMLFQDALTLRLDRLRSCHVAEADSQGRLVPFCAYNLTNSKGEYIYRRT